jgi:hypothetical protein
MFTCRVITKRYLLLIKTSDCLVSGFSFEGRREPWMVWNASTGMYVPEKENPPTRQNRNYFYNENNFINELCNLYNSERSEGPLLLTDKILRWCPE